MKNSLLIFFLILTSFFVRSQVSSYTFGTSTGTYTPIVGGSNYDNFTSWSNTNFLDDNNSSALESIGFNFVYNGTTYTQFAVNTNGFITLGVLPTNSYCPLGSGTVGGFSYTAGASNNVISAMGTDLIGRGSLLAGRILGSPVITITSGDISQILVGDKVSGAGIPAGATVLSKTANTVTISANAVSTSGGPFHFRFSRSTFGIRFQTIGTAPNRSLVVQWTGWQRYTLSGGFGELYNFQIRLNETTNTINIVYNIQGPTSTTATTFQIGLRGSANTDFNNRTTTTNWASTTAGTLNSSTVTLSSAVKPTSGLTYTWTPPVIPVCSGTPNPGNTLSSSLTTSPNGTVNLSLQNTTTGTGVTYQWQSSPDNSTWTNFGTSSSTQTSPPITSPTWFRSTVTCSGNSGISTPIQITLSYCTYNITNNDPTGITSVTFGTISNTSIGGPAYSDFTTQSTTVEQGGIYQLNVNVNTDGNWTVNTKVWIDWNQNYIFEVGEEYSLGSALNTANGITSLSPLNITVPSGATLGETRMRIVSVEASDPAPLACGTQLYGEAEDYKLLITPPTGLPVELLYFDGFGYQHYNTLKWSTASEHNSDYFSLERSVNGEQWDYVGTTKATGNSTQVVNYLYVDNFRFNGFIYYKLNQFDFDGNFKVYGPISINNTHTNKKVVKYINILGQEVSSETNGFIFEVYEDGTTKRIIR
jgi:hypothetical protein